MPVPSNVGLEGQIVQLYREIDGSTSPSVRARLRQRIVMLATRPGLFRYLERDPAEVGVEQWEPGSPTMMAFTVCCLAMTAITTNSDSSEPPPIVITQVYECVSAFLPRAFPWIPYLHPAYGTLTYHPVHHAPFINALHTMYHFGKYDETFRDRAPMVCGYIASFWCFLVLHPEMDIPLGDDTRHPSEALATCVLDMLDANTTASPRSLSTTALKAAVRAELLLVLRQSPRRVFSELILASWTLLARPGSASPPNFEPLKLHMTVVVALARDVFPSMRHTRRSVKLAVEIVRLAPCSEVMTVACDLILSIWNADLEDHTFRWALRCGIVDALKCDRSMRVSKPACATVLQHIAARTTSRRVLVMLQGMGEASASGAQGIASNGLLTSSIESIVRRRVELLRELSAHSQCALNSRTHWKEHRRYCLWRWSTFFVDYDGLGKLSVDAGFVFLQVIDHILSQRGQDLYRELMRAGEDLSRRPDELVVEILLDRCPPQHQISRIQRMGAPQKPVLILKARVFLREHMTISWQAKSLSRFAAALASLTESLSI
ncbi:hypothetical protein EV714DRAFT_288167 [Schizophyllum commune]